MFNPVEEYFHRALWGHENAARKDVQPRFRSYLTAFALHASHSLNEELDRIAAEPNCDQELKKAIKSLPHRKLIENMRNMDLHGLPLPICDPSFTLFSMVSKPEKGIELTSRDGVGVALTMAGVKPQIHRNQKDLKRANVKFGSGTNSFGCVEGHLVVHDFSTGKQYVLIEVLKVFLIECEKIIKLQSGSENNIPKPPDSEANADRN